MQPKPPRFSIEKIFILIAIGVPLTCLFLTALFGAAFIIFIFSRPAHAHDSWISRGQYRNATGEWCCGATDCQIVKDVKAKAGGYSLPSGEIVPYSEATPSPDGAYWRCHRADGSRRCFFAPPPGS